MLARLPFSETGLEAISLELARSIAASLRTPRKVLALDCDGVLWGGVVGEDGVEGVKIGEDPIGRAHKNLQRFVRSLKARGLFLALCSKNNEEDVHSVFDDREEMELSLEDVAVETINWDPKSQNLRRISKALNVGVDSIVFLDDDPAEIAEVRAHLPEVATLLLPKDISQAVEFLANQECFDRNAITDEDLGRTAMIRAEKSRAIATNSPEGQPNLEDFLAELELVATVSDAIGSLQGVVRRLRVRCDVVANRTREIRPSGMTKGACGNVGYSGTRNPSHHRKGASR